MCFMNTCHLSSMFSRAKRVVSTLFPNALTFLTYLMVPSFVIYISLYCTSDKRCERTSGDPQNLTKNISNNGTLSSSVWCRGSHHSNRICRFRNLCYKPDVDEFLFFHGTNSILSGISTTGETNVKSPLADFTSVLGMNTHYFTFTDVPSSSAVNLSLEFVTGRVAVVLKRFKPDNVMHVLHDDLIPLFDTLQELCFDSDPFEDCANDVRLVLLDGHSEHRYHSLYEMFSGHRPLLATDLDRDWTYCFRSAIVGISKETVWYDYGFGRSQRPRPTSVSGVTLQRFVAFTLKRLGLDRKQCRSKFPNAYAVLILRRSNRLILNDVQVAETVATKTNLRVISVYVEDDALRDVIELVSCSEMLIGMHGASMILSLFLKPEKSILEMFPYAVPSSSYTPYRTLASIPNVTLNYGVWENRIKQNTVTHPDWDPEHGGLQHLSTTERERILNSDTVLPHHCCSDPEWLFRIYQDTVVDIDSFASAVEQTLNPATRPHSLISDTWFHPGPVRNISCSRANAAVSGYMLNWDPPWNLRFVQSVTVYYKIWIQSVEREDFKSIILNETRYDIGSEFSNEQFNCWVSCSITDNNNTGITQWVACK